MDEQRKAVRISATVQGRVQGVGFRQYVLRCAQQYELRGWTRNRGDGTVEVLAQGDQQAVERFVALLRKGSAASKVQQVDIVPVSEGDELSSFFIAASVP